MKATIALGVVGSLTTLTLLFELLRRRHLREKYAILWALVALVTLVVAAVPQVLFWLSGLLGVAVPSNLLFFGASMLLFGISIHHSHELGRLEERVRTLAEEVALLELRLRNQETDSERQGADVLERES